MLTGPEMKIELGIQSVGLFLHSQQVSSHKKNSYDRGISHPTRPVTLLETNSNTNALVFLEGGFYLQIGASPARTHYGGYCSECLMGNLCARVNICQYNLI